MLTVGRTRGGLSKRASDSRAVKQLTPKQKRIDNYFSVAEKRPEFKRIYENDSSAAHCQRPDLSSKPTRNLVSQVIVIVVVTYLCNGIYDLTNLPPSTSTHDMPPKEEKLSKQCVDKWDDEHVRMPCSPQSVQRLDDGSQVPRWAMIESTLQQARKWQNIEDLINAILTYNPRLRDGKWTSLKQYYKRLANDEQQRLMQHTLPFIAELALQMPALFTEPIPLLHRDENESLDFTQQQCACLLAHAFLCTYPMRDNHWRKEASFPQINFDPLYRTSGAEQKIYSIVHYFESVRNSMPDGRVRFERRSRRPFQHFATLSKPLTQVEIRNEGRIEDTPGSGHAMVDFANMYLGGGAIGGGCVQEEILFMIYPECIVGQLFMESMMPNEAIIMYGMQRFSDYTGYGHTFRWQRHHDDQTPMEQNTQMRCSRMIAIDALPYGRNARRQFDKPAVDRELTKAIVGFEGGDWTTIATGNWGCGAFGGDKHLKALIQIIAASQCDKRVLYYTFNDPTLEHDLNSFVALMKKHNVTIGQLYHAIVTHEGQREGGTKFYEALARRLT